MRNTSDNEKSIGKLFREASAGEREAFEKLYAEFYTPLYRYMYFRLKNRSDALDLTQTVFFKFWKNIGSYKEAGTPSAFLYTIARNTLIDFFRTKKHDAIPSDELVAKQDEATVPELPRDDSFAEEIRNSLLILGDSEREIITLRFMSELSNAEISTITGKTEPAIRQIQSRALRALREHLKNKKLFE